MVVWDGEGMSPLHTRQLRSRVAPKDLWVTDVVLLPNANKVTFTPSAGPRAAARLQPTSFHRFLRSSILKRTEQPSTSAPHQRLAPYFCAKPI